MAGVGQGIYLALFPLQGFEVTPVAAGETDNPRRNVPLGTMGALVLSALLFVIVQATLVGSYPALAGDSASRATNDRLWSSARRTNPKRVSIAGYCASSRATDEVSAAAEQVDGGLYEGLGEAGRDAVFELLEAGHYRLQLADEDA